MYPHRIRDIIIDRISCGHVYAKTDTLIVQGEQVLVSDIIEYFGINTGAHNGDMEKKNHKRDQPGVAAGDSKESGGD